MRRLFLGALAAATLLFLIPAAESHAQGHHHGGGWGWGGGWHGGGPHISVGVGPGWGLGYGYGWGPGWYYPPPYYYGAGYYGAGYYGYYGYPYAYGPPVVLQQQPQYIERAPQQNSLPAGYWYYCASARGYYPTVPSCPEAWIQVPPTPE